MRTSLYSRPRSGSDGFTLVELMIVVLVMAALVIIAIPIFGASAEKARVQTCAATRTIVEIADYSYYVHNQKWASGLEVLVGEYLVSIPKCPSQGSYLWISEPTAEQPFRVLCCSVHHIPAELLLPTGEKYFVFVDSSGKITGYDIGGGLDVVIPSTIGGASVRIIGHAAFMNKGLTSVSIPDGVTSIATNAFHTNRLTSITIPQSVTAIGGNAFLKNNLSAVTIPHNVTSIGDSAFAYNSLQSVTILNRDATFGTYAFSFQNTSTKLTIYGFKGSTAEAYAKKNKLPFVALPE